MNSIFDILAGPAPVLQGGLTLMVAGWLGYQLRALPARLSAFARTHSTRVIRIYESHPEYEHWLRFVTAHAVRRDGPRTLEFRSVARDDNEKSESRVLAGEGEFWARISGRWCHVSIARESPSQRQLVGRCSIRLEMFLGSREAFDDMTRRVAALASEDDARQAIDFYSKYGSRSTVRIPKRDAATLCLKPGIFESVEQRLREFLGAQNSYERCGIPWRLGIMISGSPGTGKTSLTHAIASRLGLRIAIITLADLESDQELIDLFRAIPSRTILLIEDIDCAFRQRSGEDASGISFSGFLNCIDGVLAPNNGRVLVMTTNHFDRLDPALVRPGRVDLHVSLPRLDRQVAQDFADRVFPHVPARHDLVASVMADENPTPAMLTSGLAHHRWTARPDPRPSQPQIPATHT